MGNINGAEFVSQLETITAALGSLVHSHDVPQWLPNGEPITTTKQLALVMGIPESTAYLVGMQTKGHPVSDTEAQAASDADNLYEHTKCHHVSILRTLGIQPGQRISETKRFVRTLAGSRHFGLPIGALIVPNVVRTPPRVAQQGRDRFIARRGGTVRDIDYRKIGVVHDDAIQMARNYDDIQMHNTWTDPAFKKMSEEVVEQYDYLTKELGITVEFVTDDPYPSAKEMIADVNKNNRLRVLDAHGTGGTHPIVTPDQINKFRAVHDFFGHAATGRDFSRHGEEAAWVSHSQMFSPLARLAMTSATRGQNSSLTVNRNGFPPQKSDILDLQWNVLPEEYGGDREDVAAIHDAMKALLPESETNAERKARRANKREQAATFTVAQARRRNAWTPRDRRGSRLSLVNGHDVEPLQVFEPTPEVRGALVEADAVPLSFYELQPGDRASALAFHDSIADTKIGNKYASAVWVYDVEEYQQMRLFIANDGMTGFAIKQDGDIVSGFNRAETDDAVSSLMPLAIQEGGRKADFFDTVLPTLYGPFGFVETERFTFDPDEAPDNWDYEAFHTFNDGKPDVVMAVFDERQVGSRWESYAGKLKRYERTIAAADARLTDDTTVAGPGYDRTVWRGLRVDLPVELEDELRASFESPTTPEDLGDRFRIGEKVIEYLRDYQSEMGKDGIGIHWTARRRSAFTENLNGGYGFVIQAEINDAYVPDADLVRQSGVFGSGRGDGNESEWTVPTNATIKITGLTLRGEEDRNLIAEPIIVDVARRDGVPDIILREESKSMAAQFMSLAISLGMDTKQRHVRDSEYWGMPPGTPIVAGMKPVKLSLDWTPFHHEGDKEHRYVVGNGDNIDIQLHTWKGRVLLYDMNRPRDVHGQMIPIAIPDSLGEFEVDTPDAQILQTFDPLVAAFIDRIDKPDEFVELTDDDKREGWKGDYAHIGQWKRKTGQVQTSFKLDVNLKDEKTWHGVDVDDPEQVRLRFAHRYRGVAKVYDHKTERGQWEVFGDSKAEVFQKLRALSDPEHDAAVQEVEERAAMQSERVRQYFRSASTLPVLRTDKPVASLPGPDEAGTAFEFSAPGVRPDFSIDRKRAMDFDGDRMIKANLVDSLSTRIRTSLEQTPEGREWLARKVQELRDNISPATISRMNPEIGDFIEDSERWRDKDRQALQIKLEYLFAYRDRDQSHMFQFTEDELVQLSEIDQAGDKAGFDYLVNDFRGGSRYAKQLDLMLTVADRMSFEDMAVRASTTKWVGQWAHTSADSSEESLALQTVVAQAIAPDSYNQHFTGFSGENVVTQDLPFLTAFVDASYHDTQELFKRHNMKSVRLYRGMAVPTLPEEFDDLREQIASDELKTPLAAYLDIADDVFDRDTAIDAIDGYWMNIATGTTLDLSYLMGRNFIDLDQLDAAVAAMEIPDRPSATKQAHMDLQPLSSWSTNRRTAASFDSHGSGEPLVLEADIPTDRIFSTCLTGNGCFDEYEAVVFGGTYETNVTASELERELQPYSLQQDVGDIRNQEDFVAKVMTRALKDEEVAPRVIQVFKAQIEQLRSEPKKLHDYLVNNFAADTPFTTYLFQQRGSVESAMDSPAYLAIQAQVEKYGFTARDEYALFRVMGYSPQEAVDLLSVFYSLENR